MGVTTSTQSPSHQYRATENKRYQQQLKFRGAYIVDASGKALLSSSILSFAFWIRLQASRADTGGEAKRRLWDGHDFEVLWISSAGWRAKKHPVQIGLRMQQYEESKSTMP